MTLCLRIEAGPAPQGLCSTFRFCCGSALQTAVSIGIAALDYQPVLSHINRMWLTRALVLHCLRLWTFPRCLFREQMKRKRPRMMSKLPRTGSCARLRNSGVSRCGRDDRSLGTRGDALPLATAALQVTGRGGQDRGFAHDQDATAQAHGEAGNRTLR